jgi:hypothetical protein
MTNDKKIKKLSEKITKTKKSDLEKALLDVFTPKKRRSEK